MTQDLMLAYQLAWGRAVSRKQWWRVRQILRRHNLEVTITNVQLLAHLRKNLPRSSIAVSNLLDAYHLAAQLTQNMASSITGKELVGLLAQHEIQPDQSTLSRWFKQVAGGYKKDREYLPSQVKELLVLGFVYRAKSLRKKLPQ